MACRLIEDHLAELGRALSVPSRLRRRALLEARDHLLSAAAERRTAGLDEDAAQAAAVRAYGPTEVIARRYAERVATDAEQRASRAGVVAVLAYGALFAAGTQIAAVRAVSPFAGGPADAIGWFAAQIAVTCGGLSTIRSLRQRGDMAIPAGRLRYINRGWGVALAAILVSVSADLVSGLQHGHGATGAWALLAAAGATAVVAALALAIVLVAVRRTRALAGYADEGAGDDVLDDLRLLALAAGERLLPAGAVERARGAAARLAQTPAARAVALRSHPWRCCVLVAFSAGAALAAAHLVGEGPPTEGLLVLLAVSAIFVAIEAVAVIGCFAVLGPFLGLRQGSRCAGI
jgi:hypothetical protein